MRKNQYMKINWYSCGRLCGHVGNPEPVPELVEGRGVIHHVHRAKAIRLDTALIVFPIFIGYYEE